MNEGVVTPSSSTTPSASSSSTTSAKSADAINNYGSIKQTNNFKKGCKYIIQ